MDACKQGGEKAVYTLVMDVNSTDLRHASTPLCPGCASSQELIKWQILREEYTRVSTVTTTSTVIVMLFKSSHEENAAAITTTKVRVMAFRMAGLLLMELPVVFVFGTMGRVRLGRHS